MVASAAKATSRDAAMSYINPIAIVPRREVREGSGLGVVPDEAKPHKLWKSIQQDQQQIAGLLQSVRHLQTQLYALRKYQGGAEAEEVGAAVRIARVADYDSLVHLDEDYVEAQLVTWETGDGLETDPGSFQLEETVIRVALPFGLRHDQAPEDIVGLNSYYVHPPYRNRFLIAAHFPFGTGVVVDDEHLVWMDITPSRNWVCDLPLCLDGEEVTLRAVPSNGLAS